MPLQTRPVHPVSPAHCTSYGIVASEEDTKNPTDENCGTTDKRKISSHPARAFYPKPTLYTQSAFIQCSIESSDCSGEISFFSVLPISRNTQQRSLWLSFSWEKRFLFVFHLLPFTSLDIFVLGWWKEQFHIPNYLLEILLFILLPSHPSHSSLPAVNESIFLWKHNVAPESPGSLFLDPGCDCHIPGSNAPIAQPSPQDNPSSLMAFTGDKVGLIRASPTTLFLSRSFFECGFP